MPQSRRVLFFLIGAVIGGILAGFIFWNRAQSRGPGLACDVECLPLWQGELLYACQLKPVEEGSPGERVRVLVDPATGKPVRLVESLVKDPSKEAYYVIRRQAMFPDRIRVQWQPSVDPLARLAIMQACQCSCLQADEPCSTGLVETLQIHINTADPYPVAKKWLLEHPDCVQRAWPVFW